MDSIECTSHAKINFFLEIMGRRKDGYHEICTLFQEISLADRLTLRKIDNDYCILRSDQASLPFGKRNLCIKAYDTVRDQTGLQQTVEIHLEKHIPLGSGLGGGSSNGASVIKGLNTLFDLGMSLETMAALAARVGSDMPFFIYGGTAVGRGRGERVRPLPSFPEPVHLALIKPRLSVSSGNAYEWAGGYRGDRDLNEDELASKIQSGDLEYLFRIMHNAFESMVTAKHPEFAGYRRALEDAGCLKVAMSGSGSSFFGICRDANHARDVIAAFAESEDLILAEACHTI